MSKIKLTKINVLSTAAMALLLTACGGGSSSSTPNVTIPIAPAVDYVYQVTLTNLTNAQPMSPAAVILHNQGNYWQLGEKASVALENLAESGSNEMFLDEPFILSGASGKGVILPGMSETIDITITNVEPLSLTVATMLVNTNDAFSGVNALSIKNLKVGESISLRTSSYDSGTEKNSETAATIPGPAGEGEGFNAERDDVDFIGMHQGVVSQDDGLAQSVLTQAHRFDNPTLAISIKRVE